MEKQPAFEKILGGTDIQKDVVRERLENQALKTGEELYGENLLIPTDQEKSAILEAVDYVNTISSQYGSTRKVYSERVFLLKPGAVYSLSGGKIKGAEYFAKHQVIGLERNKVIPLLAQSAVHEGFHMTGYHSARILNDGNDVPYRLGISMHGADNKERYFDIAEEAIIATLASRFIDDVLSKDLHYSGDVQRTREIKKWIISFFEKRFGEKEINLSQKIDLINMVQDILILPDSEYVYDVLFSSKENDEYKFGTLQGFYHELMDAGDIMSERQKERKKFDEVLEEIMKNSNGKILDKKALFDEFARAHFTGNYLPLARTIEDALGKGSFRRIASDLAD